MSKLVVIIYSLLILAQSFHINIEDISKFNAFLKHCKYHKDVYGDTFLDFLSEHYGNQMMSHESKHSDHKDLPFKDDHILCHTNPPFIFSSQLISIANPPEFIENSDVFSYKDSFSSFEKPYVFQPPRVA